MRSKVSFIFGVCIIFALHVDAQNSRPVWTWKCISKKCEKLLLNENEDPQSNEVCKLLCDDFATIWPLPTGKFSKENKLLPVNINSISLEKHSVENSEVNDLLIRAEKIFHENIEKLVTKLNIGRTSIGRSLVINVSIKDDSVTRLEFKTEENYELHVSEYTDGRINATITGKTFFGVRHGLETLSQLIAYDPYSEQLQLLSDVSLSDSPVFHYRGIVIDTARSFVSTDAILKTISGMAANKLNTLHLHLTDSQSFPIESKIYPLFTKYGAYSPHHIYSFDDIHKIVNFGQVNGIRVIPEIDIPAHVGEGWQWVGENVTVCFKKEPWSQYCVEPPCGQLNPGHEKVYEILGNLYKELLQLFPTDIFHLGGDEVHINCWNTSAPVTDWMASERFSRTEEGFIKMWGSFFQKKVYDKLIEANGGNKMPAIMWTSKLTQKNRIEKYLNKDDYIIQIWTTGNDMEIKDLLESGYKVILSNYDKLYFDCGFGSWVGDDDNNWCSPYISWQRVYDNNPFSIVKSFGLEEEKKKLMLGAEAAIWTEQADSQSLDGRLWPRSAAMAERLWSNPKGGWKSAEFRMINHRERLVKRGIQAENLQPLWCHQNEGHCQ